MTMIDATDQTFEVEVLQKSQEVPVVVDLWAPWCEPCKSLGPILDAVIAELGGKIAGVKINVDENPAVSQAFQVQSIPMVVAFKDGEAVDGFLGAQGEPAIREFIGKLLPSDAEVETSELLEAGDEESLRKILETEPGHTAAIVALAELWVGSGRNQEALELLERIPETAESRHIAAMARTGVDESHASVQRLAELLPTVKSDDDARQEFVDLLEVMGAENPATAEWRKKLSAALF
ncbi:MAG: tetratricopeptide repeat protein [Actinomycetia bacterium]|nr:tetratricopeptide repeat protein [Actinomycetes bacterium]MCP4959269.1 tetratricopeptide repeat protein [Actinomycetes bacterium]